MKAFLIGLVVVMLLVATTLVGSYITGVNSGAKFEANVEKFDKASANTLSAYTMKLKEAAKVPEKYVEALQGIIKQTFEGRYGDDGSKAAFQWIKENNIPLDPSVYTKLQSIIDAGREEFKLSQDRKLEYCSQYEIARNQFWSGMWLNIAGYPKKDITKLCQVVIDKSTTDKFNTGVDAVVDF